MEIYELSVIVDSIDEEDRFVYLLTSLPDSYVMLVTALKASQDVPKWALVTEQLLYEETKIREKETGGAESKAYDVETSHQQRGTQVF